MFSRGGMELSSVNLVFVGFDNEDDEETVWEGCHSHPCDVRFWKRSGCSGGRHWGVQEKQLCDFKGGDGLVLCEFGFCWFWQ